MSVSPCSRRAVLGLLTVGAASAIGCKKTLPSSCVDTSGLQPDEIQARSALDYRDSTPFPGKTCEGCQQFLGAKADGACGGCKVLRGSIHPLGYCKSFAARS